jgi:hypothetical protein
LLLEIVAVDRDSVKVIVPELGMVGGLNVLLLFSVHGELPD